MKILLLSAPFRYYKGGSELQYTIIEENLLTRGFEVFYLFRSDEPVSEVNCHTYRYLFRKSYSRYCPTDAPKIFRLIGKLRPDVIYKRGINYISATGLYYARTHGARYIQHLAIDHDAGVPRTSVSRLGAGFDLMVNRYVINGADAIIAQAGYQDKALRESYNRTADAIIPNFVSVPEKIPARAEQVQVLWVANLKESKRPELFIQLARAFEHSQVRFVMIGRDPLNRWSGELKLMIEDTANLDYRGERTLEEVIETMGRSHVFVNTSLHEGFPNTYLQAAVNRTPIVTLSVDPDGIIEANRMGYHSRTFEKLVADTRELIGNDDLRTELGENAFRYVTEVHGLHNIEKMIDLFRG
jgi:glycosyltransferase involved in cell wall biosynthesis